VVRKRIRVQQSRRWDVILDLVVLAAGGPGRSARSRTARSGAKAGRVEGAVDFDIFCADFKNTRLLGVSILHMDGDAGLNRKRADVGINAGHLSAIIAEIKIQIVALKIPGSGDLISRP